MRPPFARPAAMAGYRAGGSDVPPVASLPPAASLVLALLVLVPALLPLAPAIAPSASLRAQESCSGPPWSSIGVEAFHCPGGRCEFLAGGTAGPSSRAAATAGPAFRFSTEPWLRAVERAGPAAGRIAEGDVLVAVNGLLVTSAVGGAELARLEPGREATLTLRRGERLVETRLVPEATCEPPLILIGSTVLRPPAPPPGAVAGDTIVGDSPGARRIRGDTLATVIDYTVPERRRRTAVDLSLGMTLGCVCELVVRGGATRWTVASHPIVDLVEPGGVAEEAGLVPGDEIREIDGHDVLSGRGRELLFSPPRGDFVVTYRRDGVERVAGIDRRIVDRRVIVRRDAPPEVIRIRIGGEGWGDRLLGSIARWWRSLRDHGDTSDAGGAPVSSGGVIARGDAWGPAALGALFRSDADLLFEVGERDGRTEVWLPDRPIVAEVVESGPADAAGLRPGDVITRVDGFDVRDPEAAHRLLYLDPPRPLVLHFLRDGQERHATLILREAR